MNRDLRREHSVVYYLEGTMGSVNKSAWIKVRDLIKWGALTDKAEALSCLAKNDIERIYEDGWNLLHHAIAENHTELVAHMFKQDLFIPPHTSETIPYLHLACAFGHCEMLDLLVSKRPDDWEVAISVESEHWKVFMTALPFGGGENDRETRARLFINYSECIAAWGVAALCRQSACLERLMKNHPEGSWFGECENFGTATFCLINSDICEKGRVDAVQQLLNLLQPTDVNLADAFKEVLAFQAPGALGVLLKYMKERGVTTFRHNPYYVLYSQKDWYTEFDDSPALRCTRLLIENDWDVNKINEPGTFPLYTLLVDAVINASDVEPELKEHLACIGELLAAGADPNYNERPGRVRECPEEFFCYQVPYSSAAEVLARYVLGSLRDENNIKFAAESVELLVKHSADMRYVDAEGNCLAHHVLSSAMVALESNYMNMDVLSLLSQTIGNLILHGADLQYKNDKDFVKRSAIPYSVYQFGKRQGDYDGCGDAAVEKWNAVCLRMRQMLRLLDAMELPVMYDAIQLCNSTIFLNSAVYPEDVRESLYEELTSHKSVRSLEHSCRIKVWRYCGYHEMNLKQLALPEILKDNIRDMFFIPEWKVVTTEEGV